MGGGWIMDWMIRRALNSGQGNVDVRLGSAADGGRHGAGRTARRAGRRCFVDHGVRHADQGKANRGLMEIAARST